MAIFIFCKLSELTCVYNSAVFLCLCLGNSCLFLTLVLFADSIIFAPRFPIQNFMKISFDEEF